MRALLIGSVLPAATSPQEFWENFANEAHFLEGYRVYDPFIGGGSTLVEASRLGAHVHGGDVDPVAVKVTQSALQPADSAAVRESGNEMLQVLTAELEHFYPRPNNGSPLHYFSIAEVTCPACEKSGPLYRNLILVRDPGKQGAVVRDYPLTVFCPTCYELHELHSSDCTELRCCGRHHHIYAGTYTGHVYRCPHCGNPSTHRELRTGIAPRRLLAVEDTGRGARRRLRVPDRTDITAIASAEARWKEDRRKLPYPSGLIRSVRRDERPRSYGIESYEQLFTPRQLLVLGRAREWIRESPLTDSVRDALDLAISNALATNNRLCGYATDYGRLSALFTVRGFSLPALSVELNPLHPRSGRGTLAACIERVARSAAREVRRHVWAPTEGEPVAHRFSFRRNGSETMVSRRNAETPPLPDEQSIVDVAVFDPPYFDYIAYDELSEFYRAWLDDVGLTGDPLLPQGKNRSEDFGKQLGRCFHALLARLRAGRPLAFTYHATEREAWQAVGIALDEARLRITALWPVRSDEHMGHHSHAGNSEWDIVVVCRPTTDVTPTKTVARAENWIEKLQPLHISEADRNNFRYALEMATSRYGTLEDGE